MHLILVIMVIIFSLLKGDWRKWETYYPTMLYVALATFLYEFISHSHFHLWELEENDYLNVMNVHFLHNLIINPLISFVYLSNYPNKMVNQITYTLKWILTFLLLEWLGEYFGLLTYHNGWHFGWSFLFVIIMFPMIRLHHVHKLYALLLSVFFVVFFLVFFDYV
ncbi:CBO0543 family protein [uncultured Metabacillus sp.]|uniref:CBO0543 family protein n=1 Tax=uncultured Metabacillus sp. TaxID=2860135 RepID=UPI00261727B5|nr:CBO0543 family protein [uncultured Metabacillus sp.]